MSLFSRTEKEFNQAVERFAALSSQYNSFLLSASPADHQFLPLYQQFLSFNSSVEEMKINMGKFEAKAQEKDPDKQIWGEAQRNKALALISRWKDWEISYIDFPGQIMATKEKFDTLRAEEEAKNAEEKLNQAAEEQEKARLLAAEEEQRQLQVTMAQEAQKLAELAKFEAEEVERAQNSELKRRAAAALAVENELSAQAQQSAQFEQENKEKSAAQQQIFTKEVERRRAEISKLPPNQRGKELMELQIFMLRNSLNNSPKESISALQFIANSLRNIINNPKNPGPFTTLNSTNFSPNYSSFAVEFLILIGFKQKSANSTEFQLAPSAQSWNSLLAAQQILERNLKQCLTASNSATT
jgi:multidrug efflux pump subunit AcrA (membrane-fusion protein)